MMWAKSSSRSAELSVALIAACSPDVPHHSGPPTDGGVVDAGQPGPALEVVSGGGRIESTTLVMTVQIGGSLSGAAASPHLDLRPAPSLP